MRTKSMFINMDQTFLNMAPIKTHSRISMTLVNKDLAHGHLYQISMDVNIKLHQEFSAHFSESDFHSLIDISSCSLHISHRIFTTGAEKSGWKLQKVVKEAYHILHNSPVRREDYESLSGSKIFPLAFCSTQ